MAQVRAQVLASTLVLLGLLGAGCGDVERIRLQLVFPDDTTEAATRAVLFIVHDPADGADGKCGALWTVDPAIFPNRSVISYPNVNDVLAAPVTLGPYPSLAFLVYAHPTKDVSASAPIAGVCRQVDTKAAEKEDVILQLERAPDGG